MRRPLIIALTLIVSGCGSSVAMSQQAGSTPESPPTAAPPGAIDVPTASVGAGGRYPDGLPRTLGGQPVLRGPDAVARARTMGTDAPFLVGVWLDVYTGPRSCPIDMATSPPGSWLHGCGTGVVPSDEAGSGASVLGAGGLTFRFASGLSSGPAVLRVHVHDQRAAECGSDAAACDRMIVADTAVWAGDALTAPGPRTVAEVRSAIHQTDPSISLKLLGDGDMRTEAGLADAETLSPDPVGEADRQLAGVYIFPSVAALRRALSDVTAGVKGSLMPAAWHWSSNGTSEGGKSYSLTARWLVIENVALSVETLAVPSPADGAYLQRLADALQASP